MTRLLAHAAEVVDRADEALAEMLLPQAVDNDADHQRVARGVNQTLNQRKPPGTRAGLQRFRAAVYRGEAARRLRPGQPVVAAGEDDFIPAGPLRRGQR